MPPPHQPAAEEREHNKRKYAREKVSTKDMILPTGYHPVAKESSANRKGKWQCPFVGCEKNGKPLSGKQNLWRHMSHVHKGEMDNRLYIDNMDGTFSSTVQPAPAPVGVAHIAQVIETRKEHLTEEEINRTTKHDDGTRVFGILDLAMNEYIQTTLLAHLWEVEHTIAGSQNTGFDIATTDTDGDGGRFESKGAAYGRFTVNDNYANGKYDLRWDGVMHMPEMIQHLRIYGLWDDEVDFVPA